MSTKKEKKKKSIFKRILKITGITFLLLIIAIVLIPIFFKDQIKELALKEANKMLKADIAVGDFDLTIFTSFPKMKLAFDDVSVTGRNEFEGVKLIDMKSFEAKLDFWSVINMEDIAVRSVSLVEPNIHVKVLESGLTNYDIMKTSEEMAAEDIDTTSSPFQFSLEYYEIVDGNIKYDDRLGNMFAEIKNINHSGSGDMTADVIDFETETEIDELTYKMDGMTYLSEVKTDLVMNILMEFKEGSDKFTLKENELSLNALKLSFDGFYEMFKGYDMMDLKLKADNTSFKDLLSLIPAFYHTGYESMVAKGSLSLNAYVNGRYDDANYPAWDVAAKVNGASINYPDMPASIDNIYIVGGSKFAGGKELDKMTVDIDQLKATFVGNTIDANFYMKNPMTDPYMKSKVNLNVDLSTIGQVYPLAEGEQYTGKLTSNISIDGKMSTLEKGEYDKFNAEGTLNLKEFKYASEDLAAPVDIQDLMFEFSPQQLKLANLKATMGKSDFSLDGEVKNYMGYLFNEGDLKGVFNYHSNLLDVDEIMPPSNETGETTSTEQPAETTETPTGDVEPMLVPKNIDFVLNTTINKVNYDGMDIKSVNGRVILRNEEAILENVNMKTLGGDVGLNGKYNIQNHAVPKVDFSYSIKELDIQEIAKNFISIEKLAPIAKYASGKITSNFTMTTDLTPSLDLVYSSLTGNGSLFSNQVSISGFGPLDKLAETINIPKLKKQTLENIRATFEFTDGKVKIKPFDVKMGKINTTIGGTTSFLQEIDYEMKMNIPKEEIPGSLLKIAEQAIEQAKKIPGFKMKELPANIPITALITNTIKDPKVNTNMKEKLMELGGDIKGGVKDLIDNTVDKAKDSIKGIVDDKVNEAKAAAEKKKQELLDAAQKQADNIKAEGKKLADDARAEADRGAKKLMDEAGANPLKKKAAEIAAKKLKEKAEDAAQKIENEANTRADNVMNKARERANAIK
ncbi:AsmA-like C-terminal region-containing protein [Brumimicrobium mesophilum]|uniref:AsmA-like C-terminal region-containing protein n=1 Tax=Brumimicrobium mesophilum TaxID=392717 RepID=UPI000D140BAC|nr:AsmA-like C-terminal region-containing protein [Brumimicrobium mesophilum]